MKNIKYIIILIVSLLLIACGGGGGSSSGGNTGGGTNPGDGGNEIVEKPVNIPYVEGEDDGSGDFNTNTFEGAIEFTEPNKATSSMLELVNPNLTIDEIISIEQTAGPKVVFKYDKDKNVLNFIAPSDSHERNVVFTAKTKTKGDIEFLYAISQVNNVYDFEGAYYCNDKINGVNCDDFFSASVSIYGVTNNVWNPNNILEFKLETFFHPDSYIVYSEYGDITDFFNIDQLNNKLTLKSSFRDNLISYAKNDIIKIIIKSSNDVHYSPAIAVNLELGTSSIFGTIVDDFGNNVGNFAENLPVVIQNKYTGKRFITNANSNGQYLFASIPKGKYFFENSDINGRLFLIGSIDLEKGENANVLNRIIDIKNVNESKIPTLTKKGMISDSSFTIPRLVTYSNKYKSGCTERENGFELVSSKNDEKCIKSYKIPTDSKTGLTSINVTVRTEEKVTEKRKNIYNDEFTFSFVINGYVEYKFGAVAGSVSDNNPLGVTTNILHYNYCIPTSLLTDPAHSLIDSKQILVMASAKDVGDNQMPLIINFDIAEGCDGVITQFKQYKDTTINSVTARLSGAKKDDYFSDNHPVISLRLSDGHAKVKENYESVKMPLILKYIHDIEKSDLISKELYLLRYIDGTDFPIEYLLMNDLFDNKSGLQKDTSKSKGSSFVMYNDNFVLPPVPRSFYNSLTMKDNTFSSFVTIEARLTFKDKKTGDITVAKAAYETKGVKTTDKGDSRLLPLFEIRDVFPSKSEYNGDYTTRRYQFVDSENVKGGDGWGRKSTLEWLDQTNVRFGDISSIHGARYASGNYRNILGHTGHYYGDELDIRYSAPVNGTRQSGGTVTIANAIGKFSNQGILDNSSLTAKQKMTKLGLTRDNFEFHETSKFYFFLVDNETTTTLNKYSCLNADKYRCWLNGAFEAEGIYQLSKAAFDQKPSDTDINSKNVAIDSNNNNKYFILHRSWIYTNRLMIEYYVEEIAQYFNTEESKIGFYVGEDEKFKNILIEGRYGDDATSITSIDKWNFMDKGENKNRRLVVEHEHHWHLTLPDYVGQ